MMLPVLFLLASQPAGAVDFELTTLALSGVPVDVAVTGGVIYVAEETGWEWSDGTMLVVGTPPDQAPDVLASAVAPGPVAGGLYLCNADGLWSWASSAAVQLTSSACSGLRSLHEDVIFDASGLHRWDGSDGTDTDLALSAGLYALGPDTVAWADPGASAISVLDSFGVSTVASGGALTALATGPDANWLLGTDAPARIRETGTDERLLAFVPEQVGTAEFDGDGVVDRWAYGAGYFYWWTGAGEEGVTGFTGFRLVTADVTADGCSDVVTISADGLLAVGRISDCPVTDADGDGAPSPVDCDDADAARHPGAFELCDGIDQDCDGVVDESESVAISFEGTPSEGSQFTVTATPDGCTPDVPVTAEWAFSGEAACSATDFTAVCVALDDAVVSVTCTIGLEGGGTVQGGVVVTVSNVAPLLDLDAVDWGSHGEGVAAQLDLAEGEQVTLQLVAVDVAADTVAFSVSSVSTSVLSTITPEGLWTTSVSPGASGEVVIDVSDEDGGLSSFSFTINGLSDEDTGFRDTGFSDTGGFGIGTDCSAPDVSCAGLCCGLTGLSLSVLLRRLLR